jgi:hypothetical protein
MIRAVLASAGAGILLLPVSVSAATPSPSPPLDTVLSAPVTPGFSEVGPGTGLVEGPLTAHDMAGAGTNPVGDMATLTRDGFVGGYGRTWIDNLDKHELQEVVIAFSGGAGAVDWMVANEKVDKANQYYTRPVSVGGIPTYYGAHLVIPAGTIYIDLVRFVKGNDYFFVVAAATADDLDVSTAQQAKNQYDFAPSNTIPPSQWPEHPVGLLSRFTILAGSLGPEAAILAMLAGLVAAAFVLGTRHERRRSRRLPRAPGD